MLLLGDEPMLRMEISSLKPAMDIYAEFRAAQAEIANVLRELSPVTAEDVKSACGTTLALADRFRDPATTPQKEA